MATAPNLDVIPIEEFTESKVDGMGVFDLLMKANKSHLEDEFNKSRIRGSEYATVYLGMLESTMQHALAFFVQQRKLGLEADLLAIQKQIAEVELEKVRVELEIARLNAQKIPAEIALLEAQSAQVTQQTSNLAAEALNIPKQGLKLDAETAQTQQQTTNLVSQELQIDAQTALIEQQKLNAVIEGTVLTAQKCKLDAEYDVLMGQKLKVVQETALLTQKVATEKAQTVGSGTDPDSVIGKQKSLYQAQTDGFTRDAEQKATKLLVDTWNVRRTTDEGTEANAQNLLYDPSIGRAVDKLLGGIGA